VACIDHIRSKKTKFEDSYIEVTYEELCENTRSIIGKMWEFVGLEYNSDDLQKIPSELPSQNYKYSKRFSPEIIEKVEQITAKYLAEFGYSKYSEIRTN